MKKSKKKSEAEPVVSQPSSLEGPRVIDEDKPPEEHTLDMHMNDLLRAESVRANSKIMKYLKPHMEKKMGEIKKITSLDELKSVVKAKALEE